MEELIEGSAAGVAVERRANSDAVMQQAMGRLERIWRRPDGKPVVARDQGISAAHSHELTLAVASESGSACDLEAVASRTDAAWRELLGEERFGMAELITREKAEGMDTAATRMWAMGECLKKAGQPVGGPMTLESSTVDDWVLFRSGGVVIATCAIAVANTKPVLIAAVAVRPRRPCGAGARRWGRSPDGKHKDALLRIQPRCQF